MRAVLVVMIALASTAEAKPSKRPKKQVVHDRDALAPLPEPAAPKEMSREDGQIVLSFFNHFIDMVKLAKGDCGGVATAMNIVIDRNGELLRMITEAQDKGIAFPKFVNDALTKRTTELIPLFTHCGDDPDVLAASERMSKRKTTDTEPR